MTEKNTLLTNYTGFVDELTSLESKDLDAFITRLRHLQSIGCDIVRLDTAGTGMCSESGEFMEIVKKLKFQGKPWDEDLRFHLKRELGDLMFYLIEGCLALGYTPMEIIQENVTKLEARYPGGKFDVYYSENRLDGDL